MTKDKQETAKAPSRLRKFLYGLTWAIVWPVLVLIVAAIAAGVFISYLVSVVTADPSLGESTSSDGVFYIELFIFGFAIFLVVALQLVRWLFRTRKWLFLQTGAKVLGVYIWMGVATTGLVMVLVTKNPEIIKPQTVQDAHLVEIVAAVGGDAGKLRDVSLTYVDGFKENDGRLGQYAPYVDSDGKFAYGAITIKRGLGAQEEKSVIAHEYLHHIWQTEIDESAKHDLTSHLMTLYGKDDWIKQRVASYSDTNMLVPTELFAFYCTESSDQYLTQFVIGTCNTYIDRATLVMIR